MRRLAPILFLLVACSAPKPAPEPPSRAERWTANRSVVRALRDFLYAGYDLRLASDRPDEARDIAGLEERLVLSRDGLRNGRLGTMNLGLLLVSAVLVARFLDIEWSFVVRGVAFVVLGVAFLGVNLRMLASRKEAAA